MIGCLLGLTPFSELDDLHRRSNKFSLDIRSLRWQDVITDGGGDVSLGNRVSETVRAEGIASSKPFIDKQFNFTALQLLIDKKVDLAPHKQLIIVTPMCNHAFQAFYLNRLGQTLRLVPPSLLWIVVEMNSASPETAEILRRIGVTYRHLVCKNNSTNVEDRRVHQRNTALEHIELHRLDGIVYFADDDNVYSLELFKQMREIRRPHL